jgi:hypothetical protein
MRVVDGVYSGEIDFYAAGAGKVAAVKELAAERGYDLAECYAYSDSISDAPLLEIVGNPTAVNPDRALRKLAIERGWQILEFRRPVPLGARVRKQLMERPAVPVAAAAAVGVVIGIAWYGHHRKRSRAASNDPQAT